MTLPVIKATVTADTAQAEAGFDRVAAGMDEMGDAAQRNASRTKALDAGMNRVGRTSGAMRAAIQNASFQFGDMAVMIGGGVDASRALATQLPQLLGPFGLLGAVMSAVVAIGIPLAAGFKNIEDSGAKMGQMLGTLEPLVGSISAGLKWAGEMSIQFADSIVNNLDRIVITAGVVAGFFAGKWVVGFVAARVATFSLAGALGVLRTAMIRTGFGALLIGAGELIYQFSRLVQATGSIGEALSLIADVGKEAFTNIGTTGRGLYLILKGVTQGIGAAFLDAFSVIGKAWDALVNGMAAAWNSIAGTGLGESIGMGMMAGSDVSGSLSGAAAGMRSDAVGNIQAGGGLLKTAMPSIQKIKDLLASIKDERITLPDLLGVGSADEADGGSGGKGKSASEKLDEELSAQEKRIAEHFNRIKALTTGGLSDKLGAWGSYFDNLVTLTGTQNDKLLKVAKAAKAGMALVDAWSAYNQVLADPTFVGRPWARVAAAGQVLAAGIGAYNAIKGVSSAGAGSSAGASGGSGGGSGAAGGTTAASAQTVSVNEIRLMGNGTFTAEQLAPILQDGIDRGLINTVVVG